MNCTRPWNPFAFGLILTLTLVSCAPAGTITPSTSGSVSASTAGTAPVATKQIMAGLLVPGLPTVRDTAANKFRQIVAAGLTKVDAYNAPSAELAETVPTLDNGLWQVFPDGHMELTWRLRADATWQDGAPLTAADYVFGNTVANDKGLGEAVSATFGLIDKAEAVDPHTLVISWKTPYVDADTFPGVFGFLPQHLLADAYATNRDGFYSLPYWSRGFVHAGAFRVTTWEPDSRVVLEAFPNYVLGAPKLQRIEVKLIRDVNTVVANLLAGSIDLTLGQTFSPEQAVDLKTRWTNGTIVTSPAYGSSVGIMFQFINPTPAALADVRLRRALTYALNRQELIDTVLAGQVPIAHAIVAGLDEGADNAAVRYDYDPQKASQLLVEMGYQKGVDGTWRDSSGAPLSMEVRGVQEEDTRVKTTLFSEASWRQFGIDTSLVMVPLDNQDGQYLATWPGTFTRGITAGVAGLKQYFHSSNVRLPENGFRGSNGPRYIDPQLDHLIDLANSTIPKSERDAYTDQAIQLMTDQDIAIGAFYTPYITGVRNGLINVPYTSTFAPVVDGHLWDLQ